MAGVLLAEPVLSQSYLPLARFCSNASIKRRGFRHCNQQLTRVLCGGVLFHSHYLNASLQSPQFHRSCQQQQQLEEEEEETEYAARWRQLTYKPAQESSDAMFCNASPESPPPTPLNKSHLLSTNTADVGLDALLRRPNLSELAEESRAMARISIPAALTGLVLYSRSMISMLFLGGLGDLELAGGSLAIGFANITGYSVLSGLASGMEPICAQAFGANQGKILALTLHRAVLLLLSASVPISLLWLNMRRILLWCGQDPQIAASAHLFITAAAPDLILLSLLHPLRIFLRTQNITFPVAYCSVASVLLHVPLNYLLVVRLDMGVTGVAAAMVGTNLNLLVGLLLFVFCSGTCRDTWQGPTAECLRGFPALLRLAAPSCISVCLEWWWYELMILLSGLLNRPKAAVASMGILIQTTSLVYVFPSALGFGASTRVGHVLGAGRPAKARAAAAAAMGWAAMLGLAAAAFTASMRHQWGRMFTSDAEILELTALALPIAGLCELGNCPQTAGCGVLRGSARPATGANINLGSFYLVGMPVALACSFVGNMGLLGLWLGLLAAQVSCAALMAVALARTDWLVEVERAGELTNKSSSSSAATSAGIPIIAAANTNGTKSSTQGDQRMTKVEEILSSIRVDVRKINDDSETAPLISYVE